MRSHAIPLPRPFKEQLLCRFTGRLETIARRELKGFPAVRRWEQTDDVIQSAVLRFLTSIDSLNLESEKHLFNAAAKQIRWTLIDLHRKYTGPDGFASNHETQDEGTCLEKACCDDQLPETLENWSLFHETVESLPANLRQSFELLWYIGLSQVETANRLGVRHETVCKHWSKSRQIIAKRMGLITARQDDVRSRHNRPTFC